MRERRNIFRNVIGTAGGLTVVLSNKPGRVERVVVNRIAAGSGFALRDATAGAPSGAIIANVTLAAGDAVTSLEYGCDFGSGLTVIVTGATLDVTIVFFEYEQGD